MNDPLAAYLEAASRVYAAAYSADVPGYRLPSDRRKAAALAVEAFFALPSFERTTNNLDDVKAQMALARSRVGGAA